MQTKGLLVVWWMTSKTHVKPLSKGVQTSPYSGFILFPTFTPKIRMFAGGRKEKFVNGPHPPDYRWKLLRH